LLASSTLECTQKSNKRSEFFEFGRCGTIEVEMHHLVSNISNLIEASTFAKSALSVGARYM